MDGVKITKYLQHTRDLFNKTWSDQTAPCNVCGQPQRDADRCGCIAVVLIPRSAGFETETYRQLIILALCGISNYVERSPSSEDNSHIPSLFLEA